MSRPETFEDLASYHQQPLSVAKLNLHEIFVSGTAEMVQSAFGLLEAATNTGSFIVERETGEISRLRNDAEKEEALNRAQRNWDWRKEDYYKALADLSSIPLYARYGVNEWANAEGLQELEWPVAA